MYSLPLTFLRGSGPGVGECDEFESGHPSREGLGRVRDRDLLRVADGPLLHELDQQEVEEDGHGREGNDGWDLENTTDLIYIVFN